VTTRSTHSDDSCFMPARQSSWWSSSTTESLFPLGRKEVLLRANLEISVPPTGQREKKFKQSFERSRN